MDAIEYLKTRTRMTNNCTINCDECLLHYKNNDKESNYSANSLAANT